MKQRKSFKHKKFHCNSMFPRDPTGSLDDLSKSRKYIDNTKPYKSQNLINNTLSPRCYPQGYAGFYTLSGGIK